MYCGLCGKETRVLQCGDCNISAQADMSDIARENAMSPRGEYMDNKTALEVVEWAAAEGTRIERARCLQIVRQAIWDNPDLDYVERLIVSGASAVPATTDTTAERE